VKHHSHLLRDLFAFIASFSLSTSLQAGPNPVVVASVTFVDGHIATYTLPSDSTLDLETCAGDLTFPTAAVVSLNESESADHVIVALTSGARWRAVADDDILQTIGVRDGRAITKRNGAVQHIDFNTDPPAPHDTTHFMKLLLEDGSQGLIDPSELVLPVETEYGKWDLPIGGLRALKFMAKSGGAQPDAVLVRYPTGRVERLALRSRAPYIRARDGAGNTLKVYHKDIMGILSSAELAGASVPSTAPCAGSDTYRMTWADGRTESIQVPLAVWTLKTRYGAITLPSEMVAKIKRSADSRRDVELRTVYGEILRGELVTRTVQVRAAPDADISNIDLDDIQELAIPTTTRLPIPEDWLVWYVNAELAIAGCFTTPSAGLMTESDEDVPGRAVNSIIATAADAFVLTTKRGQIRVCRPSSRKAQVALLVNGTTLSIPWQDIRRVEAEKEIVESKLQAPAANPVGVPELDARTIDSIPPNRGAREIIVQTAIGSLTLAPANIASVAVMQGDDRACVTTSSSDQFIVSLPSRKWFAELQNLEDYEFPDADAFVLSLGAVSPAVTIDNALVCRLMTGDILRGTLSEQSLTIRESESRRTDIDVAEHELQRISRNPDGELLFLLKQGTVIAGSPRQKHLAVNLRSTGTTVEIPFKDIETLVADGTGLPPTTVFLPGMPAFLRDEILVQGGAFQQGSQKGLDDESPVHPVSLDSFYMDSTEATKAQFAAFVRDTGHKTLAEDANAATTWQNPGFMQRQDDPVVCVAWRDAVAYCNWRSRQAGLPPCYTIERDAPIESDRRARGYRLPTEAEWEFAASGRGDARQFPWEPADAPPTTHRANYRHQSSAEGDGWEWTNPVKAFPANYLGIYGLGGNVWEWCEDWYFDRAYAALQNRNIHNPCFGANDATDLIRRVMRGGSFRNSLDALRRTSRGSGLPYAYSDRVGFRCVRNAE